MNLAIISEVAGYPWAGSEELWLASALLAQSAGWNVTACLHGDLHAGQPLEEFRAKGGRVVEWKQPKIARLAGLQQRFAPNFSEEKLGQPDVVLLSAGSLPSLVNLPGLLPWLDRSGIPYVVLCQFNADGLPISPSERTRIISLLTGARDCIFVSQHNLALAERQCGTCLVRSRVIYNPIRTVLKVPLPPSGRTAPVFGCVARMETLWKGQDLLLEILSGSDWAARDWKLRLYGDGPDRSHLEQWTRECGLSSRVTFAGHVRSVTDIWSACDLMVLPSRGEGTPLAVLEAMMCGRPVVTTDVGGNSEVIEDGITGFIAEAATPRSFGRALERAWLAREQWPEMRHAIHARAIELSDANPAGQLLQVLDEVGRSQSHHSASISRTQKLR